MTAKVIVEWEDPHDTGIKLEYVCDLARHLVCIPYSKSNLHIMAQRLRIHRCWYHRDHYDIPKSRVSEITALCRTVTSKEIVKIVGRKSVDIPKQRR